MVQCKFLDPAGEQLIQNLYGISENELFNLQIYHVILIHLKFEDTLISGVISEGQSTEGVLVPQNSSKDNNSHSPRQKHENVTVEATD